MRTQGGRTYTMVEGGDEAVIIPGEIGMLRRRESANTVRTRLTLCIFLYTVGASMMTQVYPKVCAAVR